MRVKFIVTASEPINSSYNPEGLGFSGVRMIMGAFAGWSECLPHAQRPASFFRRCMNDNVTTERRWRDPFPTGLRYYCFTEMGQRRTSCLFFLDHAKKLVVGNSSRYACRMREAAKLECPLQVNRVGLTVRPMTFGFSSGSGYHQGCSPCVKRARSGHSRK